jgi:hypothetical protein
LHPGIALWWLCALEILISLIEDVLLRWCSSSPFLYPFVLVVILAFIAIEDLQWLVIRLAIPVLPSGRSAAVSLPMPFLSVLIVPAIPVALVTSLSVPLLIVMPVRAVVMSVVLAL